jgi:hypothetical protein
MICLLPDPNKPTVRDDCRWSNPPPRVREKGEPAEIPLTGRAPRVGPERRPDGKVARSAFLLLILLCVVAVGLYWLWLLPPTIEVVMPRRGAAVQAV